VEEEAIRGDIMLRWASVLLAMLLGWTVLDDTRTLVHVRTGEYVRSHGWLPPRTDIFSATATGRPWVNLHWLWDLVVGAVYDAGGGAGLTLLAALLSLTTFWLLSRITLPGVPTWWSSVCCVFSAMACFPSLTATPEIITLTGTAALLWLMLRPRWSAPNEGPLDPGPAASQPFWVLPVLFVAWSNLDDRAWMGAVMLVAYALGAGVVRLRGKRAVADDVVPGWGVVVASLVALLVHPFGHETWLAPYTLYTVENVARQLYVSSDLAFRYERFPIVAVEFWRAPSMFSGCGLLLMGMALLTLVLNRGRTRLADVALWFAANGLAVASGRELTVASLVNAVLAGLNAQEWYRASFSQTYSIRWAPLLFTRGGRALTVLALFALAFAAVSGHLMGAHGRRVGMGLSRELTQQIASYKDVTAQSLDDRPFNFRPDQGDILLWIGQRPFIDQRFTVYGRGEPSLVRLHDEVRRALRVSREDLPGSGRKDVWQEAFNRFDITHILPRLSGINPDYVTLYDLMTSPDWKLTRMGAATAAFYRTDRTDAPLAAYIATRDATQYVDRWMRDPEQESSLAVTRGAWPQAPTFYETYLYPPVSVQPNEVQVARHYDYIRRTGLGGTSLDGILALAYGTLRHARAGLVEDPNRTEGYLLLGRTYGLLRELEASIQASGGFENPLLLRYYQAIAALHHAADCDPESSEVEASLYREYFANQRIDLALHHLQQHEIRTGFLTTIPPTHPDHTTDQQRGYEMLQSLQRQVDEIKAAISMSPATGEERLQSAYRAFEAGCPRLALELLEGDLTAISGNPPGQLLLGMLLLEVGRTSEAYDQLDGLKSLHAQQQLNDWPAAATFGYLAADDFTTALTTIEDERQQLEQGMLEILAQVVPFRFSGPTPDLEGRLDWTAGASLQSGRSVQARATLLSGITPQVVTDLLMEGLLCTEVGEQERAIARFRTILELDPQTPMRPIAATYLTLLTGEEVPLGIDTDTIPIEPDMFADDPSADTRDAPFEKGTPASPRPPSESSESAPASPPAVKAADGQP
jgi:tetratricopeptide (TPR) repeat protein